MIFSIVLLLIFLCLVLWEFRGEIGIQNISGKYWNVGFSSDKRNLSCELELRKKNCGNTAENLWVLVLRMRFVPILLYKKHFEWIISHN